MGDQIHRQSLETSTSLQSSGIRSWKTSNFPTEARRPPAPMAKAPTIYSSVFVIFHHYMVILPARSGVLSWQPPAVSLSSPVVWWVCHLDSHILSVVHNPSFMEAEKRTAVSLQRLTWCAPGCPSHLCQQSTSQPQHDPPPPTILPQPFSNFFYSGSLFFFSLCRLF